MPSTQDETLVAKDSAPKPATKESSHDESQFSPSERQSMAFAKAIVSFRDELDDIRKKKTTSALASNKRTKPQEQMQTEAPTADVPSTTENSSSKRIRIYRAFQHGLSSVLAIIIAVLQGLTYSKYEQTKDVPNAWPEHPVLYPTLLLLAVAVMALAFDICCLIAYYFPGKRLAAKAIKLAFNLHYWITGVKGLSYAVAAAVCRTGFEVGGNKDLWGWCCSSNGKMQAGVNGAHMNCVGNTVAWILAIISIAVEVLGVIITLLVNRQNDKEYQSLKFPAPSGHSADSNNTYSDTAPLLSALDSRADEVHSALGELTPNEKDSKDEKD